MSDMVKVEKLIVRINGISIELSIEEAKDLQESLNKLFGTEKEIVIQKEYWPYWVEKPDTFPWKYYKSNDPMWESTHPQIYCCN
jgi:hypothetical protein